MKYQSAVFHVLSDSPIRETMDDKGWGQPLPMQGVDCERKHERIDRDGTFVTLQISVFPEI